MITWGCYCQMNMEINMNRQYVWKSVMCGFCLCYYFVGKTEEFKLAILFYSLAVCVYSCSGCWTIMRRLRVWVCHGALCITTIWDTVRSKNWIRLMLPLLANSSDLSSWAFAHADLAPGQIHPQNIANLKSTLTADPLSEEKHNPVSNPQQHREEHWVDLLQTLV